GLRWNPLPPNPPIHVGDAEIGNSIIRGKGESYDPIHDRHAIVVHALEESHFRSRVVPASEAASGYPAEATVFVNSTWVSRRSARTGSGRLPPRWTIRGRR